MNCYFFIKKIKHKNYFFVKNVKLKPLSGEQPDKSAWA